MQQAQTRENGAGSFSLSRDELASFNARGFIGPFTLLEPATMKAQWKQLRVQLFDRRNVVFADAPPGSTIYNYDRHLDNAFLAGIISQPEIVGRVASILGPDVLCWRTEFLPKYPGEEGHSWRQAFTFGGLSDRGTPHIRWPQGSPFAGAVTIWVSFTDADAETGCIQFIPGSHHTMFFDERKGMHYDPRKTNQNQSNGISREYFGYDWRELQLDPSWEPEESKAVSVPCQAGQFIIYWSTVLHASLPHPGTTNQMQVALTARYVPTSVVVYGDMKEHNKITESGMSCSLEKYGAVLVSGRDKYKHNSIRTHTTTGVPFINSNMR